MEDRRQTTKSSTEKFSFPVMSVQEQEFEFGSCGTPGSPRSPADHLFFNGRLLPHAFPSQPANNTSHHGITYSRSTSRTSSVSSSSKDSLMSSRSNSTNSRNSSARTSTSEASERRVYINHAKITCKSQVSKDRYQANKKPCLTPQYGSSRRWQFITSMPVLKPSRSKKSNKSVDYKMKSKEEDGEDRTSSKAWFGHRLFMSLVSACIECHAMKTSSTVSVSCQGM